MNEYKAPFVADRRIATPWPRPWRAPTSSSGSRCGGSSPRRWSRRWRSDPIIFALANPDPEILPEEVAEVRDDAIMATGRSDYPNQVNNVLGFPFIFRGALDVRARGVNEDMMLAATRALAALAREEVPDVVRGAYDGNEIRFGREYLIPKPFDHRVLFHVAPAVAKAAMESGLARIELDLDEYRDRLRASLGPGREVMRWMTDRARRGPARVVFPEGHNDSVIRAAAADGGRRNGQAGPHGSWADGSRRRRRRWGSAWRASRSSTPPQLEEDRHRYAEQLFRRAGAGGSPWPRPSGTCTSRSTSPRACSGKGDVDALVAGIEANYAEILRPCLQVIGAEKDGPGRVAGLYMLAFPNRELALLRRHHGEHRSRCSGARGDRAADGEVRPRAGDHAPGGHDLLLQLRVVSPRGGRRGWRGPSSWSERRDPDLEIDGEMQADTAVDAVKLRHIYPFSRLNGPANVLVFSRLAAANAAYKLLDQLGGADVIGPVLLGMDRAGTHPAARVLRSGRGEPGHGGIGGLAGPK